MDKNKGKEQLHKSRRHPLLGVIGMAALVLVGSGKLSNVANAVTAGSSPNAPVNVANFAPKISQQAPITPETTTPALIPEKSPRLSDAQKEAMIEGLPIDENQKNFLREVIPYAEQERAKGSKISPSILVGQAIVEGAWGESVPHYNYFGVKATSNWKGATYVAPSSEKDAKGVYHRGIPTRFRAYENPGQAFADYSLIIGTQPQYADAVANYQNPYAYLQALENGNQKWATAGNDYVNTVWAVAQENHLTELTS